MHHIAPTLPPQVNHPPQPSPPVKPQILNFKNSPVKHQLTTFQQQIYETPEKNENEIPDRLRSEIRERLFYRKYQMALGEYEEEEKQKHEESAQKISLREVVAELQNEESQGYYMYKDWVNLNNYLFKEVQSRFCENLWKILRFINFGEVAIPSGLIFDIIAQISDSRLASKKQETNIIQIINQFLQDNNINNTYESFKELQYYIPLLKIIQGYKLQKQITETPSTLNTEVFEHLYQDSKIRKLKQTVKVLNTQKKETEGCTFAPVIKPYRTAEKSSRKTHRNHCESVTKNIFQTDRQQLQKQTNYVIKARPIDPRIYKAKLSQVKGLKQHVNRNVDSYMQKLRLKRSMEKPVILKKS